MSAETHALTSRSTQGQSPPEPWFAEPSAIGYCDPLALSPADVARWQCMTRPRRRDEFLLGRSLRLQMGEPTRLAHSAGYVIATNALNAAVDVEFHAPRDISGMAKFALTSEESRYLSTLGPERRLTLFYRLWVMKEALAKAFGWTLMATLADVSLLSADGSWVPSVPTPRSYSLTIYEPWPRISIAIANVGEFLDPPWRVVEWPSMREVRWRRCLTIAKQGGG